MTLWRVHLKPDAKGGDPRAFCFKNGLVGVGWPVAAETAQSIVSYRSEAEGKYVKYRRSWSAAINAIRQMKPDDLCWSRTYSGVYYLARIITTWEYLATPEHRAADITNFCRCHWVKIGAADLVPGKVVSAFIPSRTAQRVNDRAAVEYSRLLYDRRVGTPYYGESPRPLKEGIFSLISPDDCEDLVAVYLQAKGWQVLPSTCKTDSIGLEFVMLNPSTSEKAGIQVKTGGTTVDCGRYSDVPHKVFIFATSDKVLNPTHNTVRISTHQLLDWMNNNSRLLPPRVRLWYQRQT